MNWPWAFVIASSLCFLLVILLAIIVIIGMKYNAKIEQAKAEQAKHARVMVTHGVPK